MVFIATSLSEQHLLEWKQAGYPLVVSTKLQNLLLMFRFLSLLSSGKILCWTGFKVSRMKKKVFIFLILIFKVINISVCCRPEKMQK